MVWVKRAFWLSLVIFLVGAAAGAFLRTVRLTGSQLVQVNNIIPITGLFGVLALVLGLVLLVRAVLGRFR